jgi:hypothetical protein
MWRESPTCWPKAGTVRKPNPRRHQLNATQPKYDVLDSFLKSVTKTECSNVKEKNGTKERKLFSVTNLINAQIHLLQYTAGDVTRNGRMSRKSHYSTDDGSRSQIFVTSLTPAQTFVLLLTDPCFWVTNQQAELWELNSDDSGCTNCVLEWYIYPWNSSTMS